MKALTIIITAAVLAGTANGALAEETMPASASGPAATSGAWDSAIRGLPEPELKRLYQACNHAAGAGALARDYVLACSVAYDALLDRAFGGDYLALRAWSRDVARNEATSAPLAMNPAERPARRIE